MGIFFGLIIFIGFILFIFGKKEENPHSRSEDNKSSSSYSGDWIYNPSEGMTLYEAERKARNRVNAWATGAVAVGWVPGSMFLLACGDMAICQEVAECFGVKHYEPEALCAAIGASVTGKIVAGEALSFLPGFGWAIKSAVAGGITKAVGEAIIQYFKSQSPYR